MSEVTAAQSASTNWIQQASNNPLEFQKSLEDVLENFGPEETGNASAKQFLGALISALREQIADSDLPQNIKDIANATLDAFEATLDDSCPCSSEASDAVANSSQSDTIDEAATEAANEAANEGGSSNGPDAMDQVDDQIVERAGDDKKKGKNWLEALAGSLSGIQAKFLDNAMKARDDMIEHSGDADDGKSEEFLDAQGEYAANMQLFTIFSNQTSTTIKSLGEALAGISRKQ